MHELERRGLEGGELMDAMGSSLSWTESEMTAAAAAAGDALAQLESVGAEGGADPLGALEGERREWLQRTEGRLKGIAERSSAQAAELQEFRQRAEDERAKEEKRRSSCAS